MFFLSSSRTLRPTSHLRHQGLCHESLRHQRSLICLTQGPQDCQHLQQGLQDCHQQQQPGSCHRKQQQQPPGVPGVVLAGLILTACRIERVKGSDIFRQMAVAAA